MVWRRATALGTMAILLAGAGVARAQQPGITYHCDTAADHYSELVLPGIVAPMLVTGKLQLRRIAASTSYTPLTQIMLGPAGATGSSGNAVGFKLSALPAKMLGIKAAKKDAIIAAFSWSQMIDGKRQESDPILLRDATAILPFSLMFDGVTVTMKVADEAKVMTLAPGGDRTQPMVRLICSTGEFLYTELRIRPLD